MFNKKTTMEFFYNIIFLVIIIVLTYAFFGVVTHILVNIAIASFTTLEGLIALILTIGALLWMYNDKLKNIVNHFKRR